MELSKRSLLAAKHENLFRLAKYLKIDVDPNIEQGELVDKILWWQEWERIKIK
jgi:hypothetical protein